jgi:ribonucleoside-diphosphate reductase alpha chain
MDDKIPVYDISVQHNHNFYANNILVHNCQEISLPTKDLTKFSNLSASDAVNYGILKDDVSMEEFRDQFGEIALCTLSAVNWGNINKPSDFEKVMKMAVRALDNLLSYQHYPMVAAEIPTRSRRSLGIGIINFAHFLAKNNAKYGERLDLVDEYMEAMYYYGVKASVELAKERGACAWSNDTIYSDGEFIFDKRKPFVDTLVPHNPKMDWDTLREDVKKYGIRNSTLIAILPSETSSVISNSTNGIEPPRGPIVVKGSKSSIMKQVVPDIKLKYDYVWNQKTPKGYIDTLAVIQKYCDQAISTNLSYDPTNFEDDKIPMSQLLNDILYYYKTGGKNIYYMNQRITSVEDLNSESCESCKI